MDALMTAVCLYWDIRSVGEWLRVEGGKVRIDGPASPRTAELAAAIRSARAGLVRLFSEPCPCATCAEAANDGPVLRLYCPSGLDTDATWQALRRELDALDAEDERVCIQAEACGESSLSPGTACDAEGRGIRGVQRNADPEAKHD